MHVHSMSVIGVKLYLHKMFDSLEFAAFACFLPETGFVHMNHVVMHEVIIRWHIFFMGIMEGFT